MFIHTPEKKGLNFEEKNTGADLSKTSGQSMDPNTRTFMEQRFGTDFGNVRIHTDAHAANLSRGLSARAFTHGSHIYFNRNQYGPQTRSGKKLLAHELTHVIQQNRGQTKGIQRTATNDARLDNPNFLVCLALTYIGLPPDLWRTLVNHMLRAVSEQYRTQYGEERGAERFAEFSAVYSTWSLFNKVKAVLTFVGESRIGPLTIRIARAQTIRAAALRALELAGIRTASVIAASQIIRKIAIGLEVAWAAGCFLYCTAEQLGVLIRDLTLTIINAVAHAVRTLSTIAGSIGSAIRESISQAFRIARAKLTTGNWIFASDVPGRAQTNLRVLAASSILAATPDTFLTYIATPLNNYSAAAPILSELAQDLTQTMQSRGGFSQAITFTPAFLGGLPPLTLVDLLVDYRLIRFRRSPQTLAAEAARLEHQQAAGAE